MSEEPRIINKVILENEAVYVSDGKKREWICTIPDPLTPEDSKEIYANLESKGYTNLDNCFQVVSAITRYNQKEDKKYFEKEGTSTDDYNFEKAVTTFTDYLDMADQFLKKQPCFYTKDKLWWAWNFETKSWDMIDKIDLVNAVSKEVYGLRIFEQKQQTEIVNALTMRARKKIPEDAPKTWVQFKDKIIDITNGEEYSPSPKYFVTNPLAYPIGDSEETPTFDKLFVEWVGEKWKPTLYEILAYCCLPNYPIHRVFCLSGEGRNGKSSFLKIVSKLIGNNNVCSTDMDILISNRFESSKLYRKLVCEMGEINSTIFKRTSRLKKLIGDDLMGFEFKGKGGFDDYNYAKLIIATNKLPESADKTTGFYAKWLIIDFPNQFKEKVDIVGTIPEEEYNCLARKCVGILKGLLESASFTNEGSYKERENRYEERSSSITEFIRKYCVDSAQGRTPFFQLYKEYVAFCSERGLRIPTKTEVSRLLTAKGYVQCTMPWKLNDGKETTVKGREGIVLIEEDGTVYPEGSETGINAYADVEQEVH